MVEKKQKQEGKKWNEGWKRSVMKNSVEWNGREEVRERSERRGKG